MKDKIESSDNNKFYWIYLLGFIIILALPLLNLPPWFSPPDWGKTIVFRIILTILLFFFIFQKTRINKDRENTDSRGLKMNLYGYRLPLYLLLSLLGIYFLATIFSLDIDFSFWGNPYRSGGFLNFAFYIFFAILTFLIIQKRDWRKIWNFAFLIGILVSIVAIFQQFGILSKVFIPLSWRPSSTVGNPIFLAIYLLLLSFLALSFCIKEKNLAKKLFYFLSFLLFFFVAVFITQTRAVIIGYLVSSLFFIFFYPVRKSSISLALKLTALIILLFGIYGIYFVNTQTELPQFIQKNKFFNGVTTRLSIKAGLADPRISGWKVSLGAIKTRLILGYGPENFSIGFDKYYDPSLPGIEKMPDGITSWWDRAHNFIFDIGITAGIPAIIIYLSLFGSLFFTLQKLKKNRPEDSIIPHGIQATFLAYLTANLFSFDTFSTYLISFLLIGYSLHLLSSQTNTEQPRKIHKFILMERSYANILKWRWPILTFLLILLIWFAWSFNLKPLWINKELNLAIYLSQKKDCESALNEMEKIMPSKTYLSSYLNMYYAEFIDECVKEKPEMTTAFAQKAVEVLKENIKIMPYYTKSWLPLGNYTNILIESGRQDLKDEANYYFQKAYELSPKRQEVFIGWTMTKLVTGDYQEAKEKAQICINLNPRLGDCWWLKGLSEIYLKESENAQEDIQKANQKGYSIGDESSLSQLAKVYADLKDYKNLVEIYQKLIVLEPNNVQYYASLASTYKELGEYDKARQEALKILEIDPEAKSDVDQFLEGFPY